MNVPFHKEISIALADLPEDSQSFGFCELRPPAAHERLQTSAGAVLYNDVTIIEGGVHIEAFEYVGVVALSEDLDFRLKGLLVYFSLEPLEIDNFDGDEFLGIFPDAPVNLAGCVVGECFVEPI